MATTTTSSKLATRATMMDWYFGGVAMTPPATFYYGLFNIKPAAITIFEVTDGVEVTGPGYARVAITNNTTNFPAGIPNPYTLHVSKYNGTDIVWPTSTGAWGPIAGIGIYDAPTGGNLLDFELVSSVFDVIAGKTVTLGAMAYQIWAY